MYLPEYSWSLNIHVIFFLNEHELNLAAFLIKFLNDSWRIIISFTKFFWRSGKTPNRYKVLYLSVSNEIIPRSMIWQLTLQTPAHDHARVMSIGCFYINLASFQIKSYLQQSADNLANTCTCARACHVNWLFLYLCVFFSRMIGNNAQGSSSHFVTCSKVKN